MTKKKKRSNLICPPDTPRAAGARSLRGNVEVATAPSKRRGRLSRASSRALRAVSDAPKRQDYEWGLLGECAPEISNQPPPQTEREPSAER